MYWKEFLKPTPSRLIITVLLAIFFVSSMPFIKIHSSYCDENGDNCSYQNSVTSFSACLRIDFREEQVYWSGSRGVNRHYIRECNRLDLLWLLLVVPLIYVASMPISAKTIDSWRCGSKDGLVTSILLVLTLVPGVIFSFRGTEPSLYVYLFLPYNFLFATGSLPRSNSVLSIVIIVIVIAGFLGLVKLFEKWNVTHALVYLVWILYLSMLFFGFVFASVGIHPY